MGPGEFAPTSAPRALRDPQVLRARLCAVRTEPGVRALNEWVAGLRERLGGGDVVPWFDPASGGAAARVLFLLESPSRTAMGGGAGLGRAGSGVISADNDDRTAHNCWVLCREAGVSYRDALFWNVVPWYVGTAERIAAPRRADVRRALPFLHELVGLLPRLDVVVPMGRKAQGGWSDYTGLHAPDVHTLPTWHPSPQVFASRPAARQEILQTLEQVARLLGPR